MSAIWDKVIGQQRIVDVLRESAAEPSGAYLFTGPSGAGKLESARVFAAAAICPDACGECNDCRRVLAGIHPDVQHSEPEGYTYPVESIREIVASSSHSPLEAKRRVFIIEQADRIVERSQNALLKALEEPNASVTWVLIAESLDAFLPTVLSRCQIVEFAPIPEEVVRSIVTSRADMPVHEADQIVRAARGDLTKAISLATDETSRHLRQLALDALSSIDPAASASLASAASVGALASAASAELQEANAAEIQRVEDTYGTGRGFASIRKRLIDRQKRTARRAETDAYVAFLDWLGSGLRDLAAIAAGADVESLLNADRAADLLLAAGRADASDWLALAEEASAARLALLENANALLAVESLLLKIGHAPGARAAAHKSATGVG